MALPSTQTRPAEPAAAPAPDAPARPKPGPFRRFAREWILPIGLVMAVMAPIRSVVADWNDVPSGSMRPTIVEGDRIYVNKLAYGLRVPFTHAWIARWAEPRRGDIITFASPADGIRLVKRVVGVPGDRVSLKNNHLFINGSEAGVDDRTSISGTLPTGVHVPMVLARENLAGVEHAIALTPTIASLSSFDEITVPSGKLFVMGDNRDQSNDSRYIGLVPIDDVYGRCNAVALSLDPQDGYMPRWDRWFCGLK